MRYLAIVDVLPHVTEQFLFYLTFGQLLFLFLQHYIHRELHDRTLVKLALNVYFTL